MLHKYPPGHPKARTGSNFNHHRNTSVANQVYDGANKDDGKLVLTGILKAQLQQLLSLLNDRNGGTSFQANAVVAKLGCLKFLHTAGSSTTAQQTISSSPKLFLCKDKDISLSPVLLPSGEKANIVAKDLATRRMIGFGKQRDGLYYLEALTTKKTETNSHSSPNHQPTCNLTTSSSDLWHSRLGHVSHSPYYESTPALLKTYTHRPKNAYSPLLEIPTPPSPSSSIKTLLLTTSSLHSSPSLLLSSSNPSNPSPTLLRPPQSTPTETLCRSSRSHNPPMKLQDYVCSHIMHACSDHLFPCFPGPIKGSPGQWYLESHISSDREDVDRLLATARRWSLHQLDVNNAFLHDDHHEEIYMSPPLGLQRQGEEKLGYVQSRADYSLFTRIQGKSFTTLLIYVNDILITRNDSVSISIIKKFLHSQFRHKDLGDLKYFLGIEVSSSKNGIFISQRKYALEIIKNAGLLGATPIDTPMKQGLKLFDKSDLLKDPGHYRSTSCCALSKNALGQGLFFSSNSDFRLRAYCDSDWAGCPITRRSTTGYCLFLGSSLVSWKSKRQKTVLLSLAETEYHAMTGACSNPVFHERTKHIEMDCHYIQDKIQDGSIAIRFVNSAHQLANVLTKTLAKEVFTPMIRKLGV
ncbi:Retrovirus-related Pol polyprotein from transposon RE2 [Vitis vinifera]|uniref:Retrovirus-related Pol polyprotein from transposon RE2 n=1 Tax=Vitis vinifera TaxID=29760 RepID=A0A438J0H3_VITVI|nr:Retrovirus-related Pol polyprotein from transposon RE2 [Vitis vinifera]